MLNSDSGFSPIAYPWVWPLLLSPFVRFWGLDYDRLKLVEVATYCLWLVLLHGIVRQRIGWWPAIAVVTVFATAPLYLAHTDQLLTEIPQLAAVAVVIWWYDRLRRSATLLTASTRQLVVLGALVVLAFNVRRESVVLLGMIAAMALYDVLHDQATNESRVDGIGAQLSVSVGGRISRRSCRSLSLQHSRNYLLPTTCCRTTGTVGSSSTTG